MLSKNKMKKQWLFLSAFLMSLVSHAHSPDFSTSVLSKTDNGIYVLQITSSLAAFQGEIDYLYTTNAYKTPEAFKKLVVDHFNKNVFFIANEKDTLKFGAPLVLLGHESKLIVEVLNIPKNISSLYFKNSMFKDMPHNQMAVIMLADGLPKDQHVLENENEQTVSLELQEGKWVNLGLGFKPKNMLYVGLFLLLSMVPILYIGYRDRKHIRK
ncbi:hypothetical protein H8R24_08065 [Flavobacterium sp. F-60]|nr:hypothetical protein [Flavobacterium muglaense]